MKEFNFTIKLTGQGLGYVSAKNIEEAKLKIANGDWDDIYDHVDIEYGNLIDIKETKN